MRPEKALPSWDPENRNALHTPISSRLHQDEIKNSAPAAMAYIRHVCGWVQSEELTIERSFHEPQQKPKCIKSSGIVNWKYTTIALVWQEIYWMEAASTHSRQREWRRRWNIVCSLDSASPIFRQLLQLQCCSADILILGDVTGRW